MDADAKVRIWDPSIVPQEHVPVPRHFFQAAENLGLDVSVPFKKEDSFYTHIRPWHASWCHHTVGKSW